jgi:hypothetical protein
MSNILEIEFKGDNYALFGNIWWMLLLIKRIEDGYDLEFINEWLSKNDYSKKSLNEAIEIRNSDRKLIKQYGEENGINPNWLLEYRDIDPQEYLHLVKPNQ